MCTTLESSDKSFRLDSSKMGNEPSSIPKIISNKLHLKRESPEMEISIGTPTNVVHLNNDEVLKLIEKQQSISKEEHSHRDSNKHLQAPKTQNYNNSKEELRESILSHIRKSSKVEPTFNSYIKDVSTANKSCTIPRQGSFKSQARKELSNEEMDIGHPTNIVHVGGRDVVELVEKQVQNCPKTCTDPRLTQRIEEAKEVPKMLFQPDAFNETSTDMFSNTMRPIFNSEDGYPSPGTDRETGSIQSVTFTSECGSELARSSTQSNLIQRLQQTSKSVKQTQRKSEVLELVKAMHEALDVLRSIALDCSDIENEE